jgi:hypothetical protein
LNGSLHLSAPGHHHTTNTKKTTMNNIPEQQTTHDDPSAMVARAKEYTDDVASRLGDAVESASTSVGRGVDRAGKMIERTGSSAGASVRGAGRYLQESSAATLRGDFRATLGRHPGTTLAIGVCAGLLIGRMFHSYRT